MYFMRDKKNKMGMVSHDKSRHFPHEHRIVLMEDKSVVLERDEMENEKGI